MNDESALEMTPRVSIERTAAPESDRPSFDGKPLMVPLERIGGDADSSLARREGPKGAKPDLEAQVKQGHTHGTKKGATEAVANIVNCILAAGAVGGGYALLNMGIVLGVILYIASASLMDMSLLLLVHVAINQRVFDYQGLCKRALGGFGYIYTSIVQWGQGYGCMVTYLMVAADTVESLLRLLLSFGNPSAKLVSVITDRRLIVCVVLCVCLPISFLKNIGSLAKTSYISIGSVLFIAASVMYKCAVGFELHESEIEPQPMYAIASGSVMEGLGIAAFTFVTHHESLILYQGLSDGREKNWSNIVHFSMGMACSCILTIAIPAYLTFYGLTTDNILNNYANDDFLMSVCRVAFGTTMMLSFPLEHFVARTVALDLLRCGKVPDKNSINPKVERIKFIVTTLVLVLSSAIIAMFVRDLGAVLTLTGGVCASSLSYILPAVMYLRLVEKKKRFYFVLSIVLLVVGGLLFVGCPVWVLVRLFGPSAGSE